MTIVEIGRLLRSGKISCVELAEQAIRDVRTNDRCNSMITVTEEQALASALERDKELGASIDRGPFHGVPIAYKDLFYTRGVRTTAGSLVFKNFVPDHNAAVVDRLESAGAVSIGKANLHELAYGATSKNQHYGFVLNPHDLERTPGGSSGGSAALVAAGFVPMSMGTDTGGSIRIPASYCGVVGLKPTYGRVSRFGILPLAFSLDHPGPLTSTVEDCAITMDVIAGHDARDGSSAAIADGMFNLPPLGSLRHLRVGIARNFFFECVDAEVAAAVMRSADELRRLNATLVEVQVPDLHEANLAARITQLAEASALYANQQDPTLFSEETWALLEQGRLISGPEYVNAQRIRSIFRRQFDDLWKKVDVLLTPATPIPAPRLDEETVDIGCRQENTRLASTRLVRAMNFVGEPAISMPCGRTKRGLPIGLQLISPPFTEPELLQVSRTIEPHISPR